MALVVHIGYPKTGTTFLQKSVLPSVKNYYCLDHIGSSPIFTPITLDIDNKHVEQTKSALNELRQKHSNILLSYEPLTGAVFDPDKPSACDIALSLQKLGVNKIIITIRNQFSIIDSLYRQYIQQGGVLNFDDWFSGKSKFGFRMEYLNYGNLIARYHNLFGKENILVIAQEEMRHAQNDVLIKLARFLKTEIGPIIHQKKKNRSLSDSSIKLLRSINHYTDNSFQKNSVLGPRFTTWKIRYLLQYHLDPFIISKFSGRKNHVEKAGLKNTVSDYYQKENQTVEVLTGLSLGKLGYPI